LQLTRWELKWSWCDWRFATGKWDISWFWWETKWLRLKCPTLINRIDKLISMTLNVKRQVLILSVVLQYKLYQLLLTCLTLQLVDNQVHHNIFHDKLTPFVILFSKFITDFEQSSMRSCTVELFNTLVTSVPDLVMIVLKFLFNSREVILKLIHYIFRDWPASKVNTFESLLCDWTQNFYNFSKWGTSWSSIRCDLDYRAILEKYLAHTKPLTVNQIESFFDLDSLDWTYWLECSHSVIVVLYQDELLIVHLFFHFFKLGSAIDYDSVSDLRDVYVEDDVLLRLRTA